MSESTRKKIIAAILLVALIWGYNNLFSNSEKPVQNNKTTTSIQAQQVTTTAPAKPKLVNIEQKTKEPWGGGSIPSGNGQDFATTQPCDGPEMETLRHLL